MAQETKGRTSMPGRRGGLTYSQSGVDLGRADQAKRRIRELARSTFNPSVVQDIGLFAGIFRPDWKAYSKPVLVSSADGVGTKLKIAFLTGIHNTVGQDLVAHCCDDILSQGAIPLFFLDYIACGQLDPAVVEGVVEGLARGCREAQCVLLGGETAEMPDFYRPGEYDLAGFIVGIADEEALLKPSPVRPEDALLGLPSSGLHTNGYSLVRRLFFDRLKLTVDSRLPELSRTLGEELLIPHRNYLPWIRHRLGDGSITSIAHITGGGITKNLDRALPSHLDAIVDRRSWEPLSIFDCIEKRGGVDPDEMFRTFNMGIGMILISPKHRATTLAGELRKEGLEARIIGQVVDGGSGEVRYR